MSTGVRLFLSCIVRVVILRDTMLTVPTLYSLVVTLRDTACDTSVIHWSVVTLRDTTSGVLLGCLIGFLCGNTSAWPLWVGGILRSGDSGRADY